VTAAIPLTTGVAVPGPEAARPARLQALAALGAAGWPSRRRERWRYTDLEPLASGGFDLAPQPLDRSTIESAKRLLADEVLGTAAQQLVLLDGERVEELGAAAIAGVEIAPAIERSDELAAFAHRVPAADYPLAALNTAFTPHGHGISIKIPAGTSVPAPIHLVLIGSGRGRVAAQPRIDIEADAGAEITVVQHFVDSSPEAQTWSNCVTEIKQAPGSRVTLHRLQRHAGGVTHTSLLSAELGERAALTVGYFDLGGRLVRNDIAISLRGAGARTDLFGLLLAGANEHIDDHTLIRHAAGETTSAENVRAIIGERGRGVFNGKVVVERDCQRIDAQQRNDNLLLGDHAEIDTKPELEIYANDVKCSHGSTVGELDMEQLFYLRARGLTAAEARRVLTVAFATTVVEQVGDLDLRRHTLEQVKARLASLTEQ
jgi:Fe-S cluster assembly protein SufD